MGEEGGDKLLVAAEEVDEECGAHVLLLLPLVLFFAFVVAVIHVIAVVVVAVVVVVVGGRGQVEGRRRKGKGEDRRIIISDVAEPSLAHFPLLLLPLLLYSYVFVLAIGVLVTDHKVDDPVAVVHASLAEGGREGGRVGARTGAGVREGGREGSGKGRAVMEGMGGG